jgi:nucleoside-diphosphate-sugar epimerase
VRNYDALREQMRGCDAVVHLAAIPQPVGSPAPEVFRANCLGTFHVFKAAEGEGIRRVVQASSINAFGAVWGTTEPHVDYLPIDEEHPTFTTDSYSFSKGIVEEIGAYFWRRAAIPSVALRLPWVRPVRVAEDERFRQGQRRRRAAVDELAALPEPEQRARVAALRQCVSDYRAKRPFDYWPKGTRPQRPAEADDPLFGVYHIDRFNFWACVDERDSAQAIDKGLTADYEGSHVLFINDCRNALDYDAETLARLFFPDVEERRKPLEGPASLVSIDKARALIGFEPEYPVTAFLRQT